MARLATKRYAAVELPSAGLAYRLAASGRYLVIHKLRRYCLKPAVYTVREIGIGFGKLTVHRRLLKRFLFKQSYPDIIY